MSATTAPILLVEDSLPAVATYEEYLKRAGYAVVSCPTAREARLTLAQLCPAALVLDLHLPDGHGLDILQTAKAHYSALPVIVITGDREPDLARQAITAGAYDFIQKPFDAARLIQTLRLALERSALDNEVQEWRQALATPHYYRFIGQSPAMQAVYRIIESVAHSKASVFIAGESGTGKELAAEALHQASPRRAHPFIALNCAAIPDNLLESTLFGHVKGAFTGALQDHAGALREADGGTLLLDEIGDMPLALQAKLLRFLQSGEFTSVGGNKPSAVDVRIVAATHRTPLTEVKAGRFREDLYYRLHVVPLELPPLRERGEDIILLAQHFVAHYCHEERKALSTLDDALLARLRQHDWPGNVRQLQNLIHSLVLLNDSATLTAAMLPPDIQPHLTTISDAANSNAPGVAPLWKVEQATILAALHHTAQDVVKAAALLEISPSTLYRKLQQWKTAPHTSL
jgi:two-component system repressor protein LuxO